MPYMIPDRMLSGASAGEKRIFSILQKLPDDCIVYHENNCTGSYVDFIVISPHLGLLVIEVKGWYAKNIIGGDTHDIKISYRGQESIEKHPLRQAREYMYKLMDRCREDSNSACLLNSEGNRLGKFVFPFGHMVVLSNIKKNELIDHKLGNLTELFKPENCICRDELLDWEDDAITTEQLVETLRSYFQVQWNFTPLSENQISIVRSIIHPEIRIPSTPASIAKSETTQIEPPISVKVLDSKQEQNAYGIGEGHRLLFGVAGSGKTIILTTRARILSHRNPKANILLLCYNVTLSVYLKKLLSDCPNVNVKHFDGWSRENGVTRRNARIGKEWVVESDEDLGNRLLTALENGARDTERYDAVLVDEAQDFHPTWFSCVLEAMVDRLDGDLVIVGDGAQGIYGDKKISWKQLGIKAIGRSIGKKFDLNKNYRNTREIVEMASLFADSQENGEDESTVASPLVDVESCIRSTEVFPVLVESRNLASECDQVVEIVKNLLAGSWFDQSITPVAPEEIGILYPFLAGMENNYPFNGRNAMGNFVSKLQQLAPTLWLSKDKQSRGRICAPGIKVQTIHSAKGLQYKIVIVLWGGLLPAYFGQHTLAKSKKLMYVALTRAEDFLLVSYSGKSQFIEQMSQWKNNTVIKR